MVRCYLWTLLVFWLALYSWEARSEGIQAQIKELIKLENEIKDEYDRSLRYKNAFDCVSGEQKRNLSCFARNKLGIKIFGSCPAGKENCKVKVDLGSGQTEKVALVNSDEDSPVALNKCGTFRQGSRCRCTTVISLNIIDKGSTNLTKIELHMQDSDAAWQKVFASTTRQDSFSHEEITKNATFKAAEGACQ